VVLNITIRSKVVCLGHFWHSGYTWHWEKQHPTIWDRPLPRFLGHPRIVSGDGIAGIDRIINILWRHDLKMEIGGNLYFKGLEFSSATSFVSSCKRVFGILFQNATFQTRISDTT